MLLLIDIFSINKGRGYENPSLEIIVTEHCSTGGCPLEEACEHFYLNQSAISVAISYIIFVYCEDYAGYFIVILSFLAFHFYYAYFIYLVSCRKQRTQDVCTIFLFIVDFNLGVFQQQLNRVQIYKRTKSICKTQLTFSASTDMRKQSSTDINLST
jgi:hypothetical protein